MSKKHPEIKQNVKQYFHRHAHILFGRILYVALFAVIQATVLILMFQYAWNKLPYFYIFCMLISFIAAVHIINKNNNPAFKIAWLIPIFIVPIFGGFLYLMFGRGHINKQYRIMSDEIREKYRSCMPIPSAEDIVARLSDRDAVLQSAYITNIGNCLPYANTETSYFASGEDLYPEMLALLKRAKRYIFLEYFIIEEGIFWNSVLEILEDKVKEGLDVRVMYDDFGSIFTLPLGYEKTLREKGIRTQVFNPFNTILSPRPNNRDHRKICVVDGTAAIAGGINLADEYLNLKEKYGYWKDTAILLRGDAAWGIAVQFLCVWAKSTGDTEDISAFVPSRTQNIHDPSLRGIVQPYTDIPLDNELVGETVYYQMITRAKHYVYITTPYLILDHEMLTALQITAKSGIDVRIITPHIPDKRIVFFLTRSYYKPLMDAGVKIYEFTPGFIHSKTMVVDDLYAVVGSINFDYRSLYLHLENAVWMYDTPAVTDVYRDFRATMEQSQIITEKDLGRLTWLKKLWLSVLRTFAPLL